MSSVKEKKLRPIIHAAIIPSTGIGDALIFLQAAEILKESGYKVTIFHSSIISLAPLIPSFSIHPRKLSFKDDLSKFDLILTQYDDSPETKDLISLKHQHENFYIFYPSYKAEKHASLRTHDFASKGSFSMVKNLKDALAKFLQVQTFPFPSLNVEHLTFKKEKNRVIIHPLSKDLNKAWPLKKYLKLANILRKMGYHPVFIMKSEEQKAMRLKNEVILCKSTLSDLAALIYESGYFIGNDSGPGHMASLLNIPSLIIADDQKRMNLWKPDFHPVNVVTASHWIPNLKTMRLRKNHWSFFISVKKVLRSFNTLIQN